MLNLIKSVSVEPTFDYDNLEAHELANLLPMIDDVNFTNLRADIEKNGILEPILIFEGRILDGRNRYRAGKAVGRLSSAKFKTFEGSYAEAEAFVFSTNFLRRQMTNAQKQEVIRKMIEKYPNDSNRQIARRCGISSHAKVRQQRRLKMARGKSQGIQSRNNRNVSVRTGAGAKAVREGGAAQVGIMYGTHVTTGRAGKRYEGERLYGGDGFNKVKYGNEVALNVGKGGPGTGRDPTMRSGSQGCHGAVNPGNPRPVKKTQIEDFGPDYQRKGRFG